MKFIALRQITEEIIRAQGLDKALRSVVKRINAILPADACSIYLFNEHKQHYERVATHSVDIGSAKAVTLELDHGLLATIATHIKPLNLQNVQTHPHYRADLNRSDELRGFIGVPILYRTKLLGILIAQSKRRRRFSESAVAFLQTLAAQLAGSIAMAKIRGELNYSEQQPVFIEGVPGSSGIVAGIGVLLASPLDIMGIPNRKPLSIAQEITLLRAAIATVVEEYQGLAVDSGQAGSLFEAYAMIAGSDELLQSMTARIEAGNWAPGALSDVIKEYSGRFSVFEDPYLRERGDDIQDIGRRILAKLLPQATPLVQYAKATILLGEHLTPADLLQVPVNHLKAAVSGSGSPHSHLAMLGQALGIPVLTGLNKAVAIRELDQKKLVLDGYSGKLYIEPSAMLMRELERLMKQEKQLTAQLRDLRDLPTVTSDGVRINLFTNAGMSTDLSHSIAVGSEGIGLYRTELPFMTQKRLLTEQEQQSLYAHVLNQMVDKPVVFRMLDIGGDKPLPYWTQTEANPFLGWRGIRILLDRPELFMTQVRALLKADAGRGQVKLLLPMISCTEDLDTALSLIRQAETELLEEGVELGELSVGMMVEVPAIIYLLDSLVPKVDFLSIGSNDLTQYLLAVDRNNEQVQRWFSIFHPAVLRSIQTITAAGLRYNKPVYLCGEAAGNPAMTILLIGMGVRHISLGAGDLLRIKKVIRTVSHVQAKAIVQQMLCLDKAADIEIGLQQELLGLGLAALIKSC